MFSLSKSAATTWFNVSELALLVFGAVLVLGIFGEYKKLPKRMLLWPVAVFQVMVMIGVAGELLGDGGVFIFSRRLQAIEDAELKTLGSDADALKGKFQSVSEIAGIAGKTAEMASNTANDARQQADELTRDLTGLSSRLVGVNTYLTPRSLTQKEMDDLRDAFKPFADRNVRINVVWSPISEGPGIQVWRCLRDAGFEKANLVDEYTALAVGVSGSAPLSHAELLKKISSTLLKAQIGPWFGTLGITAEGTPVTIVVGGVRTGPLPRLKEQNHTTQKP